MSIRSELRPYKVISDGDITGNITSLPTVIQKISLVTYTYSWSGSSPLGTLAVQVSNDYSLDCQGNVANAGNWSAIPFLVSTATALSLALSGSPGAANITIPLCGAYAIRTIFIATSGSGTLQAYICGKVS